MLVKDGNRLKYVTTTGEEVKEYRKVWEAGGAILDQVMNNFSNREEELITDEEVHVEPEETVVQEPVTEE